MSYWLITPNQDTNVVDFVADTPETCETRMISPKVFIVKCDEKPKNANTAKITQAAAKSKGW